MSAKKEFHHPEGQPHPRPPSHHKKVKSYDFGWTINGEAKKLARAFLKRNSKFDSEIGIAEQIKNFVYHKDNRKRYVDFVLEFLARKKRNRIMT